MRSFAAEGRGEVEVFMGRESTPPAPRREEAATLGGRIVSEQKLPTSRLLRLGKLAALGARTGASLLTSKGTARARRARRPRCSATCAASPRRLGRLRADADGFIPEDHRAAYSSALGKLRIYIPPSSFASVKRTIEEELGAPLDERFDRFEEAPFASASIGQVHRAFLRGRTEVAVKVQHAGIKDAVEADLANASILEGFARFGGGGKS